MQLCRSPTGLLATVLLPRTTATLQRLRSWAAGCSGCGCLPIQAARLRVRVQQLQRLQAASVRAAEASPTLQMLPEAVAGSL
jgi:hypothetical protein